MAEAETIPGPLFTILVGDGQPEETFTHLCTINAARGLSLSANTNDSAVPDCDNPQNIPWTKRNKVSKAGQITGAGTLHSPDQEEFFAWLASDEPRNCKVISGGSVYTGKFHCTQFDLTGDFGVEVTANITLLSSGAITRADAEPIESVPSVPSAFVAANWSVAPGDEKAVITITALPDNGGSAITDIEYRVDDGAWVSSGTDTTGAFDAAGLTNAQLYVISLRAVNVAGVGPASSGKAVTPND